MPYMREISAEDLIRLRIMREIRQDLNVTQLELGIKSDNSRSLITAVENGYSGTTWANALVILERLGCRVTIECPALDRVYIVKGDE